MFSIAHVVGYTDEKALYCTSRDRVASFLYQSTCTLYMYGNLGQIVIWDKVYSVAPCLDLSYYLGYIQYIILYYYTTLARRLEMIGFSGKKRNANW